MEWMFLTLGLRKNGRDTSDWFNAEGEMFLWSPVTAAAETVIELLLENRLQNPHQSHVIVVPCIMKFLWRKKMGKEANLLFTIPVGN